MSRFWDWSYRFSLTPLSNSIRGSRIVFSSDMTGNKELFLLSGGRLTRLTNDPAVDEWPVPDRKGENIVFTSNRAGSYDIYILNLESGRNKKI